MIFLQKSSIFPLPRNTLWTTQIQIHGIAKRRYIFRRIQKLVRIIGAELDCERAIKFWVSIEKEI
jgi:hypothetical protein